MSFFRGVDGGHRHQNVHYVLSKASFLLFFYLLRALTANGCAAVLGAEFCNEGAKALSHRVLPLLFHMHIPVVHKKYVSKEYLNKYTTAGRIRKLDRNMINFLRSEMQSCRIFIKESKKKIIHAAFLFLDSKASPWFSFYRNALL